MSARRQPVAGWSGGARRAVGSLRTVQPPPGKRWPLALQAGIAISTPVLVGVLTGNESLGLLASSGAFTVLHVGMLPVAERAKVLPMFGLALVLAAALGSSLSRLAGGHGHRPRGRQHRDRRRLPGLSCGPTRITLRHPRLRARGARDGTGRRRRAREPRDHGGGHGVRVHVCLPGGPHTAAEASEPRRSPPARRDPPRPEPRPHRPRDAGAHRDRVACGHRGRHARGRPHPCLLGGGRGHRGHRRAARPWRRRVA
ncbi:hypothetical protein [Demequina litorisediminis]|uniref:hypothetical protein n=1 Tax=Demequina litorisediminis TaxID=1849022 RepID=UPI0024E14F95|nr:hypothetical protein [Demequina litorisediminis]